MNPYARHIVDAKSVLNKLIELMCNQELTDMRLFRHIAAVYVVWQHELQQLELAALEWRLK